MSLIYKGQSKDSCQEKREQEHAKCTDCKKNILWSSIERDLGICNSCADRQYERSQARREWDYYHND